METLVLAGGSGFVGRNIVERLRGKFRIIVLDRQLDNDFFSHRPDVETHVHDFCRPGTLDKIIQEARPDIIVNLVSIVTAARDLSLFEGMVATNIKVLLEMYKASEQLQELKLFVQFGSSEEYGPISPPYEERAREQPNSPYSLVKQITTNTALMLHRNNGFPSFVVRPGNLFGKYQPEDKLIPYLISRLSKNLPLELTECAQKRDFIYVEDFVDILGELLSKPERVVGKIVNIAYGHGIRIRDLVVFLKEALHSDSEIRFGALPYRNGEMMEFECDIHRLQDILQHGLRRDFYDALREYLSKEFGIRV